MRKTLQAVALWLMVIGAGHCTGVDGITLRKPTWRDSKPPLTPTIANFAVRTIDAVQTCQALSRGAHEAWLHTQSCGGIAGITAGMAGGAFIGDWWLRKHNHPRLAQLQWGSTIGSGFGITYTVKEFWMFRRGPSRGR